MRGGGDPDHILPRPTSPRKGAGVMVMISNLEEVLVTAFAAIQKLCHARHGRRARASHGDIVIVPTIMRGETGYRHGEGDDAVEEMAQRATRDVDAVTLPLRFATTMQRDSATAYSRDRGRMNGISKDQCRRRGACDWVMITSFMMMRCLFRKKSDLHRGTVTAKVMMR